MANTAERKRGCTGAPHGVWLPRCTALAWLRGPVHRQPICRRCRRWSTRAARRKNAPRSSPRHARARSRPVHPAQLYSAIDAGLLCWLVWSFYPLRRRDGQALALLLTAHPITRFLLEIIRTDEPTVFGTGLSISQNISIGIFVFAIGLWWHLSRRPGGVFDWSSWCAAAPRGAARVKSSRRAAS